MYLALSPLYDMYALSSDTQRTHTHACSCHTAHHQHLLHEPHPCHTAHMHWQTRHDPHHTRHQRSHGRTYVGISRAAEMWRFKLSPPCEDCLDQLSSPMTAARRLGFDPDHPKHERGHDLRAKRRCGGSGGVNHSVVTRRAQPLPQRRVHYLNLNPRVNSG